jgi:hypothetical protein
VAGPQPARVIIDPKVGSAPQQAADGVRRLLLSRKVHFRPLPVPK